MIPVASTGHWRWIGLVLHYHQESVRLNKTKENLINENQTNQKSLFQKNFFGLS